MNFQYCILVVLVGYSIWKENIGRKETFLPSNSPLCLYIPLNIRQSYTRPTLTKYQLHHFHQISNQNYNILLTFLRERERRGQQPILWGRIIFSVFGRWVEFLFFFSSRAATITILRESNLWTCLGGGKLDSLSERRFLRRRQDRNDEEECAYIFSVLCVCVCVWSRFSPFIVILRRDRGEK